MIAGRNAMLAGGEKTPYWGLSFTAEEAGSTVALSAVGSPSSVPQLVISNNAGKTWQTYTIGDVLTLNNVGDNICFAAAPGATNTTIDENANATPKGYQFVMTGKIAAYGDIQSLRINDYGTADLSAINIKMLFSGCSALTHAPELPVSSFTNSQQYFYYKLFAGCTSLSAAPALPATKLAEYCYSQMFLSCTSLTVAPDLPATQITSYCYAGMFQGCTSLARSPVLPAMAVRGGSYQNMFNGCTSLSAAPDLPATQINAYGYASMFEGCTSLSAPPPVLPITNIDINDHCYYRMFFNCSSLSSAPVISVTSRLPQNAFHQMFYGCTSLLSAPEILASSSTQDSCNGMFYGCTSLVKAPSKLPASITGSRSFQSMFYNCKSLQTAPELPATVLYDYCYNSMFYGCTSLEIAPVLSATTLKKSCYANMFYNCSKLNYVDVKFTSWDPTNATTSWLYGVAPNGDFMCPTDLGTDATITRGTSYCPTGWNVGYWGLKFTAEQANSKVKLTEDNWGSDPTPSISLVISYDNGVTWEQYTPETNIKLTNVGDSVCFAAAPGVTNQTFATETAGWFFVMEGKLAASGEVCSLRHDDKATAMSLSMQPYCYAWMFYECGQLTTPPKLSETASGPYCYTQMFDSCTSLSITPVLPALVVSEHCYESMFSGCTGLLSANAISATTLAQQSHEGMFYNCTSLTAAPALQATALANNCYNHMFNNCSSLIQAPALPATTLANGCYTNMFYNCTSLTAAPKLQATTLVNGCYQNMFRQCRSLTNAPALLAQDLVVGCYYNMFLGCSSLSSMEVNFTAWASNINATSNWLSGVASAGQFLCPPDLGTQSTITRGVSNCPANWTVVPRVEVPVQWIKSDGVSYIELPDVLGYAGTTAGQLRNTISVDITPIRGTAVQNVVAMNTNVGVIMVPASTATYTVQITLPTAANGRIQSGTWPDNTRKTAAIQHDDTYATAYFDNALFYQQTRTTAFNARYIMAPRILCGGTASPTGWSEDTQPARFCTNTLLHRIIWLDGSGNTVFDLTPVRIGTIAYLKDAATGQLFGNSAATGDILYGPDVT